MRQTRKRKVTHEVSKDNTENDDKPVRKPTKQKANHINDVNKKDVSVQGDKRTKKMKNGKKCKMSTSLANTPPVFKEEFPVACVGDKQATLAQKLKTRRKRENTQPKNNAANSNDKTESAFFIPAKKTQKVGSGKNISKKKHVRDITIDMEGSKNCFDDDMETDIKSKSKKRNPVKGKAKEKTVVPGEANVKLDTGDILPDGDEDCGQMSHDSDTESEWEEVEELPGSNDNSPTKSQLPAKAVEITIEGPVFNQKRKKKRFDMEAWFKRQMNRYQKDLQQDKHKVHLICLLTVGLRHNDVLNNDGVRAMAMSLVPSELSRGQLTLPSLKRLTKWFCQSITMITVSDEMEDEVELHLESQICKQYSDRKVISSQDLTYLYVGLLRTLNVAVRLLISLNTVPLKVSNATKERPLKRRKSRDSKVLTHSNTSHKSKKKKVPTATLR